MPSSKVLPELLAPAGNWECVTAAVENGADAIYFGMESGFNARARADNFSASDLPQLMETLHQRNVRGYVTLNTLAFPQELAEVEHLLRLFATSGVDAVLVQDVGVARLARAVCPQLPLHASTQMTMTSAECLVLAEQLGMERVVLARELSIDEIRRISDQSSMALEAFVHGALCVAYSGQCLTSESLGGRSANRGQCAQACRLGYTVFQDGQQVELQDQQYLLSPQDLAAYELVPQLIDAGVQSLKIEGRLKTAEYVANITRHYRQALDAAIQARPCPLTHEQQYEMEMSFSRGFSPGWLQGSDHKMLVPGTSSAKRGVLAGHVHSVRAGRVTVRLACDVAAGDGVVFAGDRLQDAEQGGRIYSVDMVNPPRHSQGGLPEPVEGNHTIKGWAELQFGRDSLDLGQLYAGQSMWKTDDPALNRRLRKTYQLADPARRVPLNLQVTCHQGQPLRLRGSAANGAVCQWQSDSNLAAARKHPISLDVLRQQLGRLGSSHYQLEHLSADIEGQPMVPHSVLGTARRAILEQLQSAELAPVRTVQPAGVLATLRADLQKAQPADHEQSDDTAPSTGAGDASSVVLRPLCRQLDQLEAAAELGFSELYAEFQDIREYRQAAELAAQHQFRLFLATPRIQKPGEAPLFANLARHQPAGLLVRNVAGLTFCQQHDLPAVADFSLNVANELTAQHFAQSGAQRVTASYDLNREQLFDLVSAVPSRWLEIVIHQHMPMFHMEHCVFCAVLSPGTNKSNCGRPCDEHQVELQDRVGMRHPLTADVGCRNTLYNAQAQSSAEIVPQLIQQGVRHFRVELLRESPAEVRATLQAYQQLLSGQTTGQQVWQRLRANNRVGVTRGTLEERNPLAII